MLDVSELSGMTEAEQDIMSHIGKAYKGIRNLGLVDNENELTEAIHTLQMFIMIRVLNRTIIRSSGVNGMNLGHEDVI